MASYRIVRHIGRGGMADAFLAVQTAARGVEKLVVVKRMFPNLAARPEIVRMFLDEAGFASSIRHPNVVQSLDLGRDNGLYIAMEYLSGETLNYVFHELRRRGDEPMPYPVACRIAADVAAGLHGAHTASDADGLPRCIIHRDVSPSNLLVCYTGNTKVLDFGVAKLRFGPDERPRDVFCGKLSYAAPEQVDGSPVDPRTDIFQLGIVLHELLTGRHLFTAETEQATLMSALHRPIPPPSQMNSIVPPELDAIVLSSLERDLRLRTASADAVSEQLLGVLRRYGHYVGHGKVASWMRRTFAERRAERAEQEHLARRDRRRRTPHATPPLFPELPADTGHVTLPTLPSLARPRRRAARGHQRARVVAGTAAALLGALGLGRDSRGDED